MIHKFEKNNSYYVLDVESGTVLELDKPSYLLLGDEALEDVNKVSLENNDLNLEELQEAYDELKTLVDQGLLYSEPLDEEIEYIKHDQVKALCLHIAHDCNLRCEYCFAGQGDFEGSRSLMSLETAKKAIDFVVKESGNRHNIEIDFFGGEPLMNFDVVKKTVDYARSLEEKYNKHFNFTMTTNGLLLNEETQNWLDENMDNIVLSLDGRKEVNDSLRKTVSQDGSYDHIIDNILSMAKKREGKKDYYVRGTYTANNLDFSEDVKHFVDLGIKSISIEPVVTDESAPYRIKEENLEQIYEEYDKLAQYNLDNDFTFFHFNINLGEGPCLYKRVSGCGAGVDYLAITPEGKIFPCHQFVSNQDFCLGDLDTGINNTKIKESFAEASLENKEECSSCWCRYFCGGGCHANAFNFNQDLKIPYDLACEMERARIESAIMLYAQSLN